MVFSNRDTTVRGPTPPGTGVTTDARSIASETAAGKKQSVSGKYSHKIDGKKCRL